MRGGEGRHPVITLYLGLSVCPCFRSCLLSDINLLSSISANRSNRIIELHGKTDLIKHADLGQKGQGRS